MTCKNCGAQMVSGQVICSNCDYDNSSASDEAYTDTSYGYDNFPKNLPEDMSDYANISNNMHNDDASDTDYKEEKPDKKKEKDKKKKEKPSKKRAEKEVSLEQTDISRRRLVKILIIIIIILIAIPVLYVIISSSIVSDAIDKMKKEAYVMQYDKLRDQVKTKINSGEEIVCMDDCKDKYDYDGIKLLVTDTDGYYTINVTAEAKGRYSDVKLEKEDCSSHENTVCSGDMIIGRIYK